MEIATFKKAVIKEKLEKAILFIKMVPWVIGEKAFSFFLAMIFLGIVVSSFLFFKYVFLARQQEYDLPCLPVLETDKLNAVLKAMADRDLEFKTTDSKTHPDLFSPKAK